MKQALIFEEPSNGSLSQTMQAFAQQGQTQKAIKTERKNSKKHRFEHAVNKVIFKVCNSHPLMNRLGFAVGEHIDLWKPNGMKVYIDIEIRKPSQMAYCPIFNMHAGPIVQKGHQKANSFTQNFMQILAFVFNNGAGTQNSVDRSNTSRTLGISGNTPLRLNGAAGSSSTNGILMGTSITTVAATDYEMGTLVATGTSSGQLQYQADVQNFAATASNTATATHTRQFLNNSGASITIKEVGIAAVCSDTVPSARYFLVLHDNLSVNYTITNTNSATVTYTFSTTT